MKLLIIYNNNIIDWDIKQPVINLCSTRVIHTFQVDIQVGFHTFRQL